jgi:hypothetical protein
MTKYTIKILSRKANSGVHKTFDNSCNVLSNTFNELNIKCNVIYFRKIKHIYSEIKHIIKKMIF